MVVSPCTTFTLPAKVASFFLSRTRAKPPRSGSAVAVLRKPCIAFGTPCIELCAARFAKPGRKQQRDSAHASRSRRRRLREKAMLTITSRRRLVAALIERVFRRSSASRRGASG
jgi:hypothetical protein